MPKPSQPVMILVDHRELGSGVPEALRELRSVEVAVETLNLGDYVLSPKVVVERKSASDFCASILDKRLFAQAAQYTHAYERVVFLVEGPSLYEVSNLHPNAIRGALSYLVVLGGVTLLPSEDPRDSALLLATMTRHAQQGLGYELSFHAKRRGATPEQQMRYLVEDLPGIGPRMARELLANFGELHTLFCADEEALRAVPGIGPKRASSIVELLRRRYESSKDPLDAGDAD